MAIYDPDMDDLQEQETGVCEACGGLGFLPNCERCDTCQVWRSDDEVRPIIFERAKRTKNVVHVFDKQMWESFAGAETWSDGSDPVWTEVNGILVIADPNGCEAINQDDHYSLKCGDRFIEMFPTQKCAIAFLAGLPSDFLPKDFGFEEV